MRLVLPIVVLTALACGGGVDEAPQPIPDGTPPIATPPEPAPTSFTVAPKDPKAPRIAAMPVEMQAELAGIKADLDKAATAEQVHAVWVRADTFAPKLDEALMAWTPDLMCYDLSLEALDAELPGMNIGCEAEGTAPVVHFTVETWKAAAQRTIDGEDDAFFALTEQVYGSGRAQTWPVWILGMWDYGGCSMLGHDTTVLNVMLATDKANAAGKLWAEPIAQIRADAITSTYGEYHDQWCMPDKPTPDAELLRETDAILSQVKLTDAERQQIEAAKPNLHGQEFSGG